LETGYGNQIFERLTLYCRLAARATTAPGNENCIRVAVVSNGTAEVVGICTAIYLQRTASGNYPGHNTGFVGPKTHARLNNKQV
jgi:hypothetical protein